MSYDLLDGIQVVELSLYAFAPSAGAVLADWIARRTWLLLGYFPGTLLMGPRR